MEYNIPLFYPFMNDSIKESVVDTLGSRWLGQGPKVDLFEKNIGIKFDIKHPLMLNSGTSALELAYELIGIKPGDEVITTPLTCTATNIPLLRRGARLVFADISPKTLNIDVNDIKNKITKKTKAIVHVSLGGVKSDIGTFDGIPTVHDAAQGIGFNNGDYLVYSFQAIKHFTTGDGGLLGLPDEENYHKAKLLRWFGIDRDKKRSYDWQAYKEREMTFDIEYPGFKYQPTDIAASMGLAGLLHYDYILSARRAIFDIYKAELSGVEGLQIVEGDESVYWLATLLVERRDAFAAHLAEHGIETNLVQIRNDVYKIFGGKRQNLPVMNEIEDKYISIPLHTNMSFQDAFYICKIIKKGW